MSDFVHKSVFLKGNLLNESVLTYSLTRIDFGKRTWSICIKDICYENKLNSSISVFSLVQCNLIRDTREYLKSTQCFLPHIATVLFKAVNLEKKITYFEPTWYQINAPEDILKIYFVNPKTEKALNLNCDVFVTVLLRCR